MLTIPLHGSDLEDNYNEIIASFDWQSYWEKLSFCVYIKRALAGTEKKKAFNMSNIVLTFKMISNFCALWVQKDVRHDKMYV